MTLGLLHLDERIDFNDPLTEHPLNRNLAAWYLAGVQPQAQTWYDLTKFRRHGTLAGASVAADWKGPRGRSGGFGGLEFTGGSSDRVEVGTWGVAGSISFCCWSFLTGTSASRDDRFLSKADGTAEANHDFKLGHQQQVSVNQYRARSGRNTTSLFGGTATGNRPTENVNKWLHIACTHETATNTGRIFINGIETNSTTAWTNAPAVNANLVYIGNAPTSVTLAPAGLIDDVRVWERLLSPGEIWQMYQDSLTGYRRTLRRHRTYPAIFLPPPAPVEANKIGHFDAGLRADTWFDAGLVPEGMFDFGRSQTHEFITFGVPPEPPTVSIAALAPASHIISPYGPQ